jgi:hypothetical protein
MRIVADESGLVFHLLHVNNSSKVFPQYILPPFLALRMFGDALERYRTTGVGGASGT